MHASISNKRYSKPTGSQLLNDDSRKTNIRDINNQRVLKSYDLCDAKREGSGFFKAMMVLDQFSKSSNRNTSFHNPSARNCYVCFTVMKRVSSFLHRKKQPPEIFSPPTLTVRKSDTNISFQNSGEPVGLHKQFQRLVVSHWKDLIKIGLTVPWRQEKKEQLQIELANTLRIVLWEKPQ